MRNDCLLCSTAGEKERKGVCKRRNIVYETFCIDCGEVGDVERGDKENEKIVIEEVVEGSHDEKISVDENPVNEIKKGGKLSLIHI